MGTFGLFSFLKLFGYEKENPKKITWSELAFIWYAGLIRGAIAFGLVLRIDKTMANRGVIVTTCLTLVVFTTIFFGSTVGLLGKCLFKESEAEEEAKEEANNQVGVEEVDSVGTDSMSNSSDKSSQINQPLIHYNEQMETEERNSVNHSAQSAAQKKKNQKGTCGQYIKRFDKLILRPLLIYKYEKDKEARAKEFYEMFLEHGDEVRKQYAKEKTQSKISPANQSNKTGSDRMNS